MKRALEASKHELHQLHETVERDKERLTIHIKRQHDIIQTLKAEAEERQSGAESKYQRVRDQHQEQTDKMLENNQKIMDEATRRYGSDWSGWLERTTIFVGAIPSYV